VFLLVSGSASAVLSDADKKHHRKHHHHHAASAVNVANATGAAGGFAAANSTQAAADVQSTEAAIVDKMKALEKKVDEQSMSDDQAAAAGVVEKGRLIVNGPLPADFSEVFAKAVAAATGCDANAVKIISTHGVASAEEAGEEGAFLQISMGDGEVEVVFEAPADVVAQVEAQAADENSKLVNGPLNSFLTVNEESGSAPAKAEAKPAASDSGSSGSLEVDTEMPYGELEPFGREDTAQELTDNSIKESDAMVDQLERAEVAEEKRAVFRAITRLRGAAITSFDGIARSQTGNIDEYNHNHQWRTAHPLHHLADEEADVSKWAFPNNAD